MKKFLRKVMNRLPTSIVDRIDASKHRAHWLTEGRTFHEPAYEDYQARAGVINVLGDWLKVNPRPTLRVLELGCSGGSNLRLLRETVGVSVEYVGLDIQPAAIAYAKLKFPDDTFAVGDDRKLLEIAPDLGNFDVLVASGVFCYIPRQRSQAVLSLAAKIVDLVLIWDDMSCFADPEGVNDGLFRHPYARMCSEAGLEIVVQPIRTSSDSRDDTFLARSRARSA